MQCSIKHVDSIDPVIEAAKTTLGKEYDPTMPLEKKLNLFKKLLKAEHSPIREFTVTWEWTDLPYWVSVHLVRHKIGIEHFVSTQRTDRTGKDRNSKPQNALVTHRCTASAQAIINISRKRLCSCAALETRQAWLSLLYQFENYRSLRALQEFCKPECIYRGFCPEMKSCGYAENTEMRNHYVFNMYSIK